MLANNPRSRDTRDRVGDYLKKQSRTTWIGIGFVFVAMVGAIEYLTGREALALYLLPIVLVAYYADRRAGVILSVVSAAAWLAAELTKHAGPPHPFLPYWSMAMRLAIFLVVTYVLSWMLAARKSEEEMIQFIVHDLRSPLTNVLTGLQTLQSFSDEKTDATQQELVDMALISSKRMLALINSLLDVPRLESGKMPLRLMEVDPELLVMLATDQVAMWAKGNGVTLSRRVDTGVLAVQADGALTERILVNLLGNALKFSPPGSTIAVRVAPFDAGMLAFSVIDQGPGIPRKWAEKVFDRFAQVEARNTGAAGTGLGLTFCKLAVEAQGGRIWLESEVGQGTRVTFTLPVAIADSDSSMASLGTAHQHVPAAVLPGADR